jgi:hypothetical protein
VYNGSGRSSGFHLNYAPDAKSKTGLALCRHPVLNDLWLLDGVASGSYKPVPDASDACGLGTPAECAAHYAREMRSALQRIQERTDEELARDIEVFGVYKDAGCRLPVDGATTLYPPPGPVEFLRARHGRKGPSDLWAQCRLGRGLRARVFGAKECTTLRTRRSMTAVLVGTLLTYHGGSCPTGRRA